MTLLKVALDWTPNINHIGFFVAQKKAFYEQQNLEVKILDPSMDNYQVTPAKKVELGHADFALCPTESIISYRTKSTPFDMIAIGAILQEDLSAIIVQANNGIQSPRDLDGKTYASFKARYEDGIVKAMVKNDGGKGNLIITYPDKLGIWETILSGKSDATWIFMNWEGVEAHQSNHAFHYFKMKDYKIPYSYSPVIAGGFSKISKHPGVVERFLEATKMGYLHSRRFPNEAVQILQPHIPSHDHSINLLKALEITAPAFGEADNWGRFDQMRVRNFVQWLQSNNLEKDHFRVGDVFTNRYLVKVQK